MTVKCTKHHMDAQYGQTNVKNNRFRERFKNFIKKCHYSKPLTITSGYDYFIVFKSSFHHKKYKMVCCVSEMQLFIKLNQRVLQTSKQKVEIILIVMPEFFCCMIL